MRKQILAAALTLLLVGPLHAQGQRIRVSFEVNERPRNAPNEIVFYRPNGELLARRSITNGTFEAPPSATEKITVTVRFAGRTLEFQEIPPTFFNGQWRIGIDTPPLDDENARINAKDVKEVWYVVFESPTAEAVRLAVSVPR